MLLNSDTWTVQHKGICYSEFNVILVSHKVGEVCYILASFILQKNITAANLTAFVFSVVLLYTKHCASQLQLFFFFEVVV